MFKSINSKLGKLKRAVSVINGTSIRLDELKINQGIILAEMNKGRHSTKLKDYEFKVFSQWGEDGILQRLVGVIEIPDKTFIEFGVEDFFEANCRFLLMKDNWRGFVIDGSTDNVTRFKQSNFYWKYDIVAEAAFITRENINDLLTKSGFDEDIGILSVDLDGNDYFILDAIKGFRPRILICEYNAVFGPKRCISVPYDAGFVRTRKHHSNLYYGASLGALVYLANKKGYSLTGTNSAGNNAFFVRNDLLNDKVATFDAENGFTQSKFRESRDEDGKQNFVTGNSRLKVIEGLPVLNVETGTIEGL